MSNRPDTCKALFSQRNIACHEFVKMFDKTRSSSHSSRLLQCTNPVKTGTWDALGVKETLQARVLATRISQFLNESHNL